MWLPVFCLCESWCYQSVGSTLTEKKTNLTLWLKDSILGGFLCEEDRTVRENAVWLTLYPKGHFKQEYLCDRRESDILDSSFIRCSLVDYLDLVGLRTSTVDICIALIVQYITLAYSGTKTRSAIKVLWRYRGDPEMQDCVRRFYEGVEPIAPSNLYSWTVTNILTHHSSKNC